MNEKEAIEQLKIIKTNIDKKYINTRNSKSIETVLNLIEKQQAEIEKKDKRLKRQFKLLQKKDKEIEELKKDNKHQWKERCRLVFERKIK